MISAAPYISWNLRLRPQALEKAYWQERSSALMSYDWAVVTRVNLLGLCALTISLAPQMPHHIFSSSIWPLWLLYLTWCWLMMFPAVYKQHRLLIVAAISLLVVVASESCMAGMGAMINNISVYEAAPKTTLLIKSLMPSHAAHHFIETTGHPKPYALNMLTMWAKAWYVLLGRYMQALISFGNSPPYAAAAQSMDNWWEFILSSPMTLHVPKHSSIEGRSTATFLFLTLLCVTPAAVCTYIVYLNQLASLRAWLETKARAAAADGSCWIEGVFVTSEQLSDMHEHPVAVVLLDPWSKNANVTNKVVALCFHAVLLGALCQLALIFSWLFVHQLFPRLLCLGWLQQYLDHYYPLQPF